MLDVPSCVPQWKAATSFFQLFSTMETHIHQRDKYGNLVPGFYSFDIEVIEKGTNLSMPVADLRFSEVVPGIQLCSFSLAEPGNFTLLITDREQINLISQVPYDFTVYVGAFSAYASVATLKTCHHMLVMRPYPHFYLYARNIGYCSFNLDGSLFEDNTCILQLKQLLKFQADAPLPVQ